MAGYAQHLFSCSTTLSALLQSSGAILLQALLSSLCHLPVCDQELLRHRVLLWIAEEATKVKAHEFEEFQTMKDLEIQNM
jgi:hypothetical protein